MEVDCRPQPALCHNVCNTGANTAGYQAIACYPHLFHFCYRSQETSSAPRKLVYLFIFFDLYLLCILKPFISTYSSLERTQSGRFDIRCLVGQPEPSGHVHDEAERVPIFNLCHPHALDVPFGALLQLLLHGGRRGII